MMKNKKHLIRVALLMAAIGASAPLFAQTKLTLKLDEPGVASSPMLYGLMTEEINYSYDGGIYGELIRNRLFKDKEKHAEHWSLLKSKDDASTIALEHKQPVNKALTTCLRMDVAGEKTGLANNGFWGIPVRPSTTYKGSFYAMVKDGAANIDVSIEDSVSHTVYATATVNGVGNAWKKYSFTLTTKAGAPTTSATHFVLRPSAKGTYWFNLVSLFPPTYNNRANGNRPDIMKMLDAMKPAFLRLPGGNYLEGGTFSTRFDWKKTLGPIDQRPGHQGTWGYRSSDGMGLLEYLMWCEELKMEPVLAVFAGYALNGDYIEAGPLLKPWIDDALEEIEYVTGDTTTRWGKKRAEDGHPAPFKLQYVEVGNEDGFDLSGSYDARFAQFFDGIKAKYPNLQVISTVGGKDWLGQRVPFTMRRADVLDEHYYRNAFDMESDANHYDNYDRKGPKIFVGEWATREGKPTPNFNSALGDAAWMTGMERNSDIVVLSCSAPLFVNVNPGGMQWESDLIGYNTLTSYGSPSYYAQQMFSNYKGDRVVNITAENVPTQIQKLNAKDSAANVKPKTYPSLFYVATRDTKTGSLYLKIVNAAGKPAKVSMDLAGAGKLKATAKMIVMKADKPEDTNTITEPEKIIPVRSTLKGIKKSFNYDFPAYSITVLQIETR